MTYHLRTAYPVKGASRRFQGRRTRPAAFKRIASSPNLLSDRAPPELHEPDNFGTFVSSPLKELLVPYPADQMRMGEINSAGV